MTNTPLPGLWPIHKTMSTCFINSSSTFSGSIKWLHWFTFPFLLILLQTVMNLDGTYIVFFIACQRTDLILLVKQYGSQPGPPFAKQNLTTGKLRVWRKLLDLFWDSGLLVISRQHHKGAALYAWLKEQKAVALKTSIQNIAQALP